MNIKESLRFDDVEYSPSEISFDEKGNPTFPGEDINSLNRSKELTLTMKVCLRELQKNGKIVCPTCGIEATILRKDKSVREDGTECYHWAFYGIKDGKYVLFTKDHVFPRSLLKFSETSKFVPMCEYCNIHKGNRVEGMSFEQVVKRTADRKIEQAVFQILLPKLEDVRKAQVDDKERHKVKSIKKFLIKHLPEHVQDLHSPEKTENMFQSYKEQADTFEFFNGNWNNLQRDIFNTLVKENPVEGLTETDKGNFSKKWILWNNIHKYQCLLFKNVDKLINMAR